MGQCISNISPVEQYHFISRCTNYNVQSNSICFLFLVFHHSSESVAAFDEQSSSLIKLNNNTVLYLREVNKFLALVCILREYSFSRQGVIDFNFLCFRDAIHKVFEIRTIKKCALEQNYDEDTEPDEPHYHDNVEPEEDDELGTHHELSIINI